MIQRLRVPLGFLVAAAVLYFATPTTTSILIGLPVAIAGAAFRGMAAGVIRKDSQLATAGPYAWTRNPLYFGSSLLAVGFAVMSSDANPRQHCCCFRRHSSIQALSEAKKAISSGYLGMTS